MDIKMFLPDLVRPMLSRLPRGQIVIGAKLGVDENPREWASSKSRYRVFLDRTIGAYLSVDMADSIERRHYFSGQYYDRATRLLIAKYLRPGDTYIDIGANIGIYTLLASPIVGPTGSVYCFEPNPSTYDLLRGHIAINRASNCKTFNLGLSDEPGELKLFVEHNHSGGSSLLQHVVGNETVTVQIRRGDDVLTDIPASGRLMIKIDTEGFEQKVLRGLKKLIARDNTMITVEVTDEWLRAAGGSAASLFDELGAMGYVPYNLTHTGLFPRAVLTQLAGPAPASQFNAVFARPGTFDGWPDVIPLK